MQDKRRFYILLALVAGLFLTILVISFWPDAQTTIVFEPELEKELEEEGIDPALAREEWQTGPSGEKQLIIKRKKLIEEIRIDKKEICPGEDVRFDMVKNPDVLSPVQAVVLGRAKGRSSILSFKESGKRNIYMRASDGRDGVDFKKTQIHVLSADDARCQNKPLLEASARVSHFQPDSADIEIISVKGLTGDTKFTYDFGDGTTAGPTESQFISHSYFDRPQTEPASSFVVTITARDAAGKEASGRASVFLSNNHFLASISGSPVIPASYNRFSEKAGGNLSVAVQFNNINSETVQFSVAQLKVHTCLENKDGELKEYSASDLLDIVTLPGRKTTQALLKAPSDLALDKACRLEITLKGDTIPPRAGKPIGPKIEGLTGETTASIYLEINPPPEAAAGGRAAAAPVPVLDKETLDKLEKARQILGKTTITPQDILELEKQGKL